MLANPPNPRRHYFYYEANFAVFHSKMLEHSENMLQNFFYTIAATQVLRLALLWGLFWGQFSKISKFGFNPRKRYFYCETNTAAFHSKLLEHIGNKLQNFFYLFLGPQILNLAFLKGSFLPTFLPNIENLNLRLFVRGVLPELPKLVETYEKQQWKGPHSPKFNSPGNRVRF